MVEIQGVDTSGAGGVEMVREKVVRGRRMMNLDMYL